MITNKIISTLQSCVTSEQFTITSQWATQVATKQFQVGKITAEEFEAILLTIGNETGAVQ